MPAAFCWASPRERSWSWSLGYLARGNDGLTLVMVVIATSVMLFGWSSGAALATVVGVLVEVSVIQMLVDFCIRPRGWFPSRQE